MMKKKKRIILIYGILLIVLFLVIYVLPNITGVLKKTDVIEYGSLKEKTDVTVYFVRSEDVYFANKTGSLKYYAQEGEMVRKGTKIIELTSGAGDDESVFQDVINRIAAFDGGESIFVENIAKINNQIDVLTTSLEEAQSAEQTELASRIREQIVRLNQKIQYIKTTTQSDRETLMKANQSINGATKNAGNYVCNTIGIVSYYLDGYEAEFTPETMTLLSRNKIEALDLAPQNMARKTVQKGSFIYKIVDNKKWYVVFWVEPKDIVKYEKGNSVTISLPLGEVDGKIYDLVDNQNDFLVILEFNKYYEEFAQVRKANAEVITSNYNGLIIKNESITTNEGQTGVFVKNKSGEFVFKPVKIISTDGESSLVEISYFYSEDGAKKIETVDVYDEILKHPN